MNIREAEFPKDKLTVQQLFKDYQKELGVDLCFQGFQEELQGLPGIYDKPGGTVLIAEDQDQKAAGIVALKKLDVYTCEMKRLFVYPAFRSQKIGLDLVAVLEEKAIMLGYKTMKLDTLLRLKPAIRLYQRLGFSVTEAYNYNPESDIVYFAKDLNNG